MDSAKRPNESSNKRPVLALVERDGRAVAVHIPNVSKAALREQFKRHVDEKNSQLQTDEFVSYIRIGETFAGGHETVKHKANEYVRYGNNGEVITNNTAESFFALLKRGHYGTFHHFSKEHTQRYCDEFSFRWDNRKVSDGERMVRAIEGGEGKRLYYRKTR